MGLFRNLGSLLRQSIAGVLLRGFLQALFFIAVGMTLPDFMAWLMQSPPGWLTSWWFRLLFMVLLTGLVGGGLYLRFGLVRVSERQQALDSLSRDISNAIHHLFNRHAREVITEEFINKWEIDYQNWCAMVSRKLGNRLFFTESDQIHFDRLGEVSVKAMTGWPRFDHLLSMLSLKFDRLREIISLVQQRPL